MAVLLYSIAASAHDFEVDGIYYYITSFTDLTVEVTYKGGGVLEFSDEYTGIVTVPETVTYNKKTYRVTSIGSRAFYDCSNVTSIIIPKGVTNIGDYAFYNCSSLTSITIPEGVTSINGSTFEHCSGLTSITIPESVTSIGMWAFYYCSSLVSITIPESVTYISDVVFCGCSSLISINIPKSITSIGQSVFSGCSSLTSITLPEGITSIGDNAFDDCSNLASITLPESVTSIGSYAFSNCSSLASITLSEGVTSIGDNTFEGCNNLASITLPESVTSIGSYAFSNCSSLASITLSEGVTSIGDYFLEGCNSLAFITCEAVNPPAISRYTFDENNMSIPLYVPKISISAYQSAYYWKGFVNIQAIPAPENVSLTINQYGSGTYCSEYALDFSEVDGLKAYVAAGYDSETGMVTLLRVKTAKAGTGLFVKGEPGNYVVPVIESTSYNALNMLVGTLENVTVNGTTGDGLHTNYKYAALEGDAEPKFYPFADGSTQKAGRAYLQIPTSWLTAATAKSISYRYDDGESTEIENSKMKIENSTVIFDLMGRRIENPVKGNIYIVNGEKKVW